ncbi:metallocarboxypeptidase A-like protein TRV_02598 [Carica papaya]|uniref:metallocarboxypeptidase A-like protein TRV_02598 n=1 Tax=Carica papaya TaxID=3649 RepID=UPI000B8CA53F|nr:metallocarboxypeptidase A-like protein TRV_02598 [Carica papaya]
MNESLPQRNEQDKNKDKAEQDNLLLFLGSWPLFLAMCRQLSFCYFSFLFLVFLTGFLIVHGESNFSPSSFTPINRDLYHSSNDLIEQMKSLVHRHPDKFNIESIQAGNKGYEAEVTVITYCSSGSESDDRSKFRILLTFGQHGRELITSELAFRILSILSEEQFLPDMDQASLNSTLSKLVIKLVPMENLNGRKLVEEGQLCERRNGRGVDLNRNWSVDWGKKEKDYDPYEENPGTAPFSEPESQIMRKLAISFDPHIWVNVHSGMEALFMPYDHKNTTPEGLPSQKMRSLLEELNKLHCHNHCMIGSGGGSVGYLAHGTATDYMYDIVRVPMAFTFEIYGDDTASSKDCFKMFNPVDQATFNQVLNDWSAAFFMIFNLGPYQLDEIHSKSSVVSLDKWVSIDEYLEGYLMQRTNRYGKKIEVIDFGMQEIRTYFRLFLLSSVLLMFMFCSRISKSKFSRPIVPSLPL